MTQLAILFALVLPIAEPEPIEENYQTAVALHRLVKGEFHVADLIFLDAQGRWYMAHVKLEYVTWSADAEGFVAIWDDRLYKCQRLTHFREYRKVYLPHGVDGVPFLSMKKPR